MALVIGFMERQKARKKQIGQYFRILLASLAGFLSQWTAFGQGGFSEATKASAPKPYKFRDPSTILRCVALSADGHTGYCVGENGALLHFENGGWDVVRGVPISASLNAVSIAADGQHGFAVGAKGIVLRLDSGDWNIVANVPTTAALRSVSLSADGLHGFAVGEKGIILRLENDKWNLVPNVPTNAVLRSVSLSDDGQQGFAVGEEGTILRLENDKWNLVPNVPPSAVLRSVSLSHDGQQGFAVGDKGTILRLDNGKWDIVPGVPTDAWLYSVTLSSNGQDGFAVGRQGAILQWKNGKWDVLHGTPTDEWFYSVSLSNNGRSGIAVGDGGIILRLDNGEWSVVQRLPHETTWLRAISLSADGRHGFAVGDAGTILRLDDGKWDIVRNVPTNVVLRSVSLRDDGQQGFAVGEEATILRLDNGAWKVVPNVPTQAGLRSVSISADGKQGFAVGEKATILRLDNGAWKVVPNVPTQALLRAVSLNANGHAFAVGDEGTILRLDNDKWIRVTDILPKANLFSVALSADGRRAFAVGDAGTILRLSNNTWEAVEAVPTDVRFRSVSLSADGEHGFVVGDGGAILRTEGDRRRWFLVKEPLELTLFAIAFAGEYREGWVVGANGTLLHTETPVLAPIIQKLAPKIDGPLVTIEAQISTQTLDDEMLISAEMSGTHTIENLKKNEQLAPFTKLNDIHWNSEDFPLDKTKTYLLKVELFDGWNITPHITELPIGPSVWERFSTFMGWRFPENFADLAKAVGVNVTALGFLYFFSIIMLYWISPATFAEWHEWVASTGAPSGKSGEIAAKILAPILMNTPHCLDAVVRRYQPRAAALFGRDPEVLARPKWIPAPLLIGDELLHKFERPSRLPADRRYEAGLEELRTLLGRRDERWIISIEGPGGVGKSSLAFQIARWASSTRPDFRLARFPILPLFLRLIDASTDKARRVDDAAAEQLTFIMGKTKVSQVLLEALLRSKRVLAVVDGVSEMPISLADALHPERGSKLTHAIIITSRTPTKIPESVIVKPQGLTLAFVDRVMDDLIAAYLGSGHFSGDDRETLRNRIKGLM
jgi:photosystem II stability/assembly factor-like uncharacterized protein